MHASVKLIEHFCKDPVRSFGLYRNNQDTSFAQSDIDAVSARLNAASRHCKFMTVAIHCVEWRNVLVSLYAILRNRGVPVLIDPGITKKTTRSIPKTDYTITDNNGHNHLEVYGKTNGELPGESQSGSTIECEKEEPYIVLYYLENQNIRTCTFSFSHLAASFATFDEALLPFARRGAMLMDTLPFPRMVIELMWLCFRGIETAICSEEHYSQARATMDFSIFYFGSYQENESLNKYQAILDTAMYADARGYKAVWTPERHFNNFGGLFPNPAILSAAIASVTRSIQIRSGSLIAPLHHPIRIAEDWSLVDNISNGRIGLSFGSGWQPNDFIFFPENYGERHKVMLRILEEVKQIWWGQAAHFKDGLGNEIKPTIYPRPVQRELPLWITASENINTFIDAGKAGANLLTHLLWQETDEVMEKINAYRKALIDHGFDPREKKITVMLHTFLGKDNSEVKELVREPLKNYIGQSVQLIHAMVKNNGDVRPERNIRFGDQNEEVSESDLDELLEIAFDRFCERASLIGTVEKCAAMVNDLSNKGINEVACLIDFGLPKDAIMQSLDYLTRLKNIFQGIGPRNYPVIFCNPDQVSLVQRPLKGEVKTGHLPSAVVTEPFQISSDYIDLPIFEADYSGLSHGVVTINKCYITAAETNPPSAAKTRISEEF